MRESFKKTPFTEITIFRNAIQVMNIAHTQVGHLPRNVAGKVILHIYQIHQPRCLAKLAPLIDRGLITVEGVIRKRQNRKQISSTQLADNGKLI